MVNFARAWRPARFDEVVGQELVVRLLCNSLYRDRLFPVYLFSGQRGCGKTTLARLFAAAVNCDNVIPFRATPLEIPLPCTTCGSCLAMKAGQHPDFIEIDAASHTGVDTIRVLIETATLLPQLGGKKIYLIDEAHMLSKAAFNALLKILEEPPRTVMFMLATTDVHKIIDTVRSRCFQLFLSPVPEAQVVELLGRICTTEGIVYEREALTMIATQTEGSPRDAINQLERVWIGYGRIIVEEVAALIGMVSSADIVELVHLVGMRNSTKVLEKLRSEAFMRASVTSLWRLCCDLLRCMIWGKYTSLTAWNSVPAETLVIASQSWSIPRLIAALQLFFEQEALMIRTTHGHIIFESAILQLCHSEQQEAASHVTEKAVRPAKNMHEATSLWLECMSLITDPLELSLVRQAQVSWKLGSEQRILLLTFPQSTLILQDTITQAAERWKLLLSKALNRTIELTICYAESSPLPTTEVVKKTVRTDHSLLASDETTQKILRVFKGTVTKG